MMQLHWITPVTAIRLMFTGVTMCLMFLSWGGIYWIQQQLAEQNGQIDECRAMIGQSSDMRTRCSTLETDVGTAQRAARALRVMFPESAEEAEFLQDLSALAVSCNVVVGDFRPGAMLEQADFREVELRLIGHGPYAGLCRWMAGIENIPRAVRISEITMTAPTTSGGDCNVDMELQLRFGLATKIELD